MTQINVTRPNAGGISNNDCALHNAIAAVCKPDILIHVGYTHAMFLLNGTKYHSFLPDIAQRFIANVSRHPDAGEPNPLEPITFELDVPDWALLETIT